MFRVTKKLTQFFFHDVLEDDRNRLAENLVVGQNGGKIDLIFFLDTHRFTSLVNPIHYVTDFQWDHAKYPIKLPLRSLSEIISKVCQMSKHICERTVVL